MSVLQYSISPARLKSEGKKQTDEITKAVCALLNSGGGKVELENEDIKADNVDGFVRTIEQRIQGMVDITTFASLVQISPEPPKIVINVRPASKVISVNYNMYLPTTSQVVAVSATTPTDGIIEILKKRIVEVDDVVSIGCHKKSFKEGDHSDLQENAVVQFKNLSSDSSEKNTLANRIAGKSNKLKSYISAFANHRGGHIYYGIDDHGKVLGEKVQHNGKGSEQQIRNKVTAIFSNCVWPFSSLEKGEHWDIFFEKVVDRNGNPVPSTFVIVIYIASCSGGVFTHVPESYHLVEGNVKQMRFEEWWKRFTNYRPKNYESNYPSHISRLKWSSKKNHEIFYILSEKLVDHRDAGDMIGFEKLCAAATAKFPKSDAELVVKAGEVTIAYKSDKFTKAESLLKEFEDLLPKSKDTSIFKARLLLSQCLVKRSTGDYEESFEIAHRGLQLLQDIPVGLVALWLYLEAAMNASCVAFSKENEPDTYHKLKVEALQYLEMAARVASKLEELKIPFRMDDFQHKVRIYQTWVLLNCSVTGEVSQRIIPCAEDIEAAAEKLASVYESVLKNKALTRFREIECILAECDLFRRRWEANRDDLLNLEEACKRCSNAKDLAEKYPFNNLLGYANKRLKYLQERLALCDHSIREEIVPRTFMGMEY